MTHDEIKAAKAVRHFPYLKLLPFLENMGYRADLMSLRIENDELQTKLLRDCFPDKKHVRPDNEGFEIELADGERRYVYFSDSSIHVYRKPQTEAAE